MSTMAAFAVTSTTPFSHSVRTKSLCSKRVFYQSQRKSCRVTMQTEPADDDAPVDSPAVTPVTSDDEQPSTTSASELLKTLREESAADTTESTRSMLGIYRDVDGKSNVWAVEPQEETDTNPQISKVALIGIAAIFIVVALLALPLLPLTNPDQL